MLTLAAVASTQPSITEGNMPITGDYVTIAICDDPVVPGPAGCNRWAWTHHSALFTEVSCVIRTRVQTV